MAEPRRLAKLTRPRPHRAVARSRLFAMLDEMADAAVVWVAGPPGAGKTTLVSTYVEHRGMRTLWYQVDPGDRDPAAFFYHLALVGARGSRRGTLPAFAPEHRDDLSGFARLFFRRLFARLPRDVLLVLDNFQEAEDSGLTQIVRDAASEAPSGARFIVISRFQPPSKLCELEVRGRLRQITWSDLRLTLPETRSISARRGLTDERITSALHAHADGWVAGITLLLARQEHMAGEEPVASSETREVVFDYFASSVFNRLSPGTRRTLLSLAFLPRIHPAVAEALTGSAEAAELLKRLWRRQLFIDRRPGAETIYEFHAMFRAFLRTKAEQSLPPDKFDEQRLTSAEALARHGDWDFAFELFMEARCWERAATVVRAQAEEHLATGRCQTVVRWVESFPDEFLATDLWLRYWLARAHAQNSPQIAARHFESLQAAFALSGDRTGRVLALAGLLYACALDHSDFATISRTLDVLAGELTVDPPTLGVNQELEAWSALLTAGFNWSPWHSALVLGLQRVEALLAVSTKGDAALKAAASALLVASRSGDMDRADRLAATVIELVDDSARSAIDRTWAMFQLAHQRFVKADYEASLEWFERTWELAETNGLRAVLAAVLKYRFMADFRLKDRSAVDAAMRKIRALPSPAHSYSRALLTCYEARYAQVQGDLQRGGDLALSSHAEIVALGAGFHEICYGLINGEILLAAGRASEARPMVQRSRALIEKSELLANFLPSAMLVEAWLEESEGQVDESHRLLRVALQKSRERFGWCQMRFVDTTCAHMFRVALERDIEAPTARRLIQTFRLRPQIADSMSWPWPFRLFLLGRFEVQRWDEPITFERKAPRKLLGLLQMLVLMGPDETPEEKVIDALWPDEDGDAAYRSLGSAVLRLRRLLGDVEVIRHRAGRLSIDRERCWVDTWAFEDVVNRFRFTPPGDQSSDWSQLRSALASYKGHLLPFDGDIPWMGAVRERLRGRYAEAVVLLSRHVERQGCQDEARTLLRRGIDLDPSLERVLSGGVRLAAVDSEASGSSTSTRKQAIGR